MGTMQRKMAKFNYGTFYVEIFCTDKIKQINDKFAQCCFVGDLG